jgi:hypothetical protein
MSGEWEPKTPNQWYGEAKCLICGEKVTAPPFIASKPRRGPTIYVHTECFKQEQREYKEVRKQ